MLDIIINSKAISNSINNTPQDVPLCYHLVIQPKRHFSLPMPSLIFGT